MASGDRAAIHRWWRRHKGGEAAAVPHPRRLWRAVRGRRAQAWRVQRHRGALRTLPSDNATAATGVAPSIEETLDYHVDGHGCGTHKFALFGKKPSEAMCGPLASVEHLHHLNILKKMSYLSREHASQLTADWGTWKKEGDLTTPFELQKEAVAGKWEPTGDAMAQLLAAAAHFADWRRFATLEAHYLSSWNTDLQFHFELLQQMLHSAETLFDFFYNFSYELQINSLFHWTGTRHARSSAHSRAQAFGCTTCR